MRNYSGKAPGEIFSVWSGGGRLRAYPFIMRGGPAPRNPCKQHGDQRKGGEREKRNRDKAEPVDVLLRAGHPRAADARRTKPRDFLLEVVKRRDAYSHDGQGQRVEDDTAVLAVRSDTQHDDEWIHQDALIPAERTRDKKAHLAKVQAPGRRDNSDEPRRVEPEAAKKAPHGLVGLCVLDGCLNRAEFKTL